MLLIITPAIVSKLGEAIVLSHAFCLI